MSNSPFTAGIVSSRYDFLREQLRKHSLYDAIHNENNLRVFMEHHVYAVWDFMSLIKSLQTHLAPASLPWVPPKNSRYANFINQLVLEEESDNALTETAGLTHASHFESYLHAMAEVGANIHPISRFIDKVSDKSLDSTLQIEDVPVPAKRFMAATFDIIGRNQPHLLVAALAYGRESLVPQLFRSLQEGLQISPSETPILYGYLERHIRLDEEEHGPLAIRIVQELCDGSTKMQTEAIAVAEQTLAVRLEFWDGIYEALSV